MIDPGLRDRVVVVTGANHGIGAASARAFARCGASVVVSYLRLPLSPRDQGSQPTSPGRALYLQQQAADGMEVVARIRAAGGNVAGSELDLTAAGAAQQLFDDAERTLGPVEVLVNNAAYCAGDTFLPPGAGAATNIAGHNLVTFSAEGFERHAAVNTRAVGLLMTEFARRHIARDASWGRIVNLSTDAAATFPSEVSYGATKYAIESLSRSAACELARFGVTVNMVAPGPTQSGYISPEAEPQVVARIPLGRLGTPEDVADVIVFLASEQARWLTGQILYAGGGKTM